MKKLPEVEELCAGIERVVGCAPSLGLEGEVVVMTGEDPELLKWCDGQGVMLEELAGSVVDAGYEVVWKGYTLVDNSEFLERHVGLVVGVKAGEKVEVLREALAAGIGGFGIRTSTSKQEREGKVRVCIATNEVFGPSRNGGIGTAYTALAELLGKDAGFEVTVLYNNEPETDRPMAEWVAHYAERGVQLVGLDPVKPGELRWQDEPMWRAWASYRWLQEHDRFDVVHFPECNGQGFYALQAKQCGLAFEETTFCVGTHSSTRWIYECGGEQFSSTWHLQIDYLEQRSVELADVVVSPSLYLLHWMRGQGWELPQVSVAQQNIQPYTTRMADGVADAPLATVTGIRELVFFGRLESRKGIHTFCDALDLLNEDAGFQEDVKVTFMGKQVDVDGVKSEVLLAKRSEGWKFDWQILDDKNQDEAVTYLQGEGRLAVMPSPVDNSPYTVLECIGLKIPFIATRAGGIPELIHAEDLAQATFYHRDRAQRPGMLAARISEALKGGIRPPRRAVSAAVTEKGWVDFHRGCVAQKIEVVMGSYEVVKVGETASGEKDWVVVVDPEVTVIEGAVEKLVKAAGRLDVDVVTGFADPKVAGEIELERNEFPLGGHGTVPMFWNCYGRGVWVMRSDVYEAGDWALEGLRDGRALIDVAMSGFRIEIVPEVVCRLPEGVRVKDEFGADYELDDGAVDAYLQHMPEAAGALIGLVRGQRDEARKMMDELWHLRWKTGDLEEQLKGRVEKYEAEKATAKEQKEGFKAADRARKDAEKERDELKKRLGRTWCARVKGWFGRN